MHHNNHLSFIDRLLLKLGVIRGGYGDDIMATAHAKKLKEENPEAKIIVGDGKHEYYSPIFKNNPYINRLKDLNQDGKVIWLRNYYKSRPYLDYSKSNNIRHFFTNYKAMPGDIFISKEIFEHTAKFIIEKKLTSKIKIFIEPNIELINKDWGFSKWQKVVNALKNEICFIQPIYKNVKLLSNVFYFKSKSFIHSCSLLNQCNLFIGTEGGFHHAAAAFKIPAIVIFGGQIHPNTTGYNLHTNIYVENQQSPCGMIASCKHCRDCMEKITVKQVVNAIKEKLTPLFSIFPNSKL